MRGTRIEFYYPVSFKSKYQFFIDIPKEYRAYFSLYLQRNFIFITHTHAHTHMHTHTYIYIYIYIRIWLISRLVGWLFRFTVYQPFSGHLTLN